jgi:hypothetical protein
LLLPLLLLMPLLPLLPLVLLPLLLLLPLEVDCRETSGTANDERREASNMIAMQKSWAMAMLVFNNLIGL